ncbi:MAG TPA: recombinase family protein, partial [Terriglobales bacterium]|nr:recombinase family protein [Terriglobales bacterium]
MPSPAAQYLRMSTEHQQYSLANQSVAINLYAVQHGFAVVQTYQDEGRSGLVLRERPGLKQLLEDVVSGQSRFRAILVYDVSRWGRFQDIDEAAHYEFMCKSMGVPVHYCAETFGIDTSMVNGIMKALKRTMASEYSRELSEKVSAGAKRLVSLGYKQGGMAGYGFRRLLISADGTPKQILAPGQRKSLATDRVILTHGPAQELKCVREIYRLVVDERRTPTYIARELNRRHIPYLNGTLWYQEAVTRILTHPKYKGYVVYGQRDQKLHKRSTSVPKERWLMAKGRHQPIVSPEVFEQAQSILGQRTHYMTNEQLLDGVRHLWAKHGRLSLRAIDDSPDLPSNRVYVQRFGSFWNVCKLVG